METKISKIEDFLISLEKEELTEQQSSMMLQAGPPGGGGQIGPEGDKNKRNCNDTCNSCNMVAGCGK